MKRMKRILAGALGGALVLGLLAVSLGLSGDPLSEKQAERRAIAYAERIYPGQTFTVKDITRDRPFSYRAEVQSIDSEDTRFSVTTDFWVHTSDVDSHGNADHVLLVEEKWNTRYRLGKTAAKRAAAIFEVELPEIRFNPLYGVDQDTAFVDLCCREEEWERYKGKLTIDMPFDAALLNEMPACLTAVILKDEQSTDEELEEALVRIRTAMEKHGMMFDFYDITLIRADGEGEVLNSGMIAAEEIGG